MIAKTQHFPRSGFIRSGPGHSGGAALLYVIAGLLAVAALAAAIQPQFGSTVGVVLTGNRADNATYAAYSGLNYAAAQNDSELAALYAGGPKDFTLVNGLTFRLTVGAKNTGTGKYPVTVLGMAASGTSGEANAYMTASITPVASGGGSGGVSDYVMSSGGAVKVAGFVEGDILADTVTLQGGSTVSGSLTTTSSSTPLVITGGVTVGGTGEVICSNSSITVSGGSNVVNGTLYSQGDVTIDGGATVNGDIYAKGTVTINGGAKVNGNIHSQSQVDFLNGKMGTSTVKQYIYAGNTVTVTGGSTIYVDIHSQANIALQNITVYGNMYAKTGVTTQQYLTHLYGSIFANPTAPTAPVACQTYTAPTAPIFTASTARSINSQTTITSGNYYYTSFSTAWTDLCLDVSGGDINIFVSGNTSSNATIYVKTTHSGNCFNQSNKMENINEPFYAAAAKVFLYTGGTFTLGGGVDWFGTVLANGNIYPEGGTAIIGSLHSINGTVNPNNRWYEIKYVKSNYLSSQ
jgi:cytoskeletal protein CcmA (bactofilin family)